MRSYRVALWTGKGSMPHMRVFICGSGRVGKTCLVNSLLDLPYDKQSDSTIGVKLDKAACSLEQEDGRWTWRKEQSEEKQHELLAAKMLVEEIKRKALKKDQAVPDLAASSQTDPPKAKRPRKSAEQMTGQPRPLALELDGDEVTSAPSSPADDLGILKVCRLPNASGLNQGETSSRSDSETMEVATFSPDLEDLYFRAESIGSEPSAPPAARTDKILRDYKLRADEISRSFLRNTVTRETFLKPWQAKTCALWTSGILPDNCHSPPFSTCCSPSYDARSALSSTPPFPWTSVLARPST